MKIGLIQCSNTDCNELYGEHEEKCPECGIVREDGEINANNR